MSELDDIVNKDNWYYTIGGVWECVSATIDVEDASAELTALRARVEELERIAIESKMIIENIQKLLGVYTTTEALSRIVELQNSAALAANGERDEPAPVDMGQVNGVRLTYVNGNVFATPAKGKTK